MLRLLLPVSPYHGTSMHYYEVIALFKTLVILSKLFVSTLSVSNDLATLRFGSNPTIHCQVSLTVLEAILTVLRDV